MLERKQEDVSSYITYLYASGLYTQHVCAQTPTLWKCALLSGSHVVPSNWFSLGMEQ